MTQMASSLTLKEKQRAYWNAHFEAIRLLGMIGLKWPPKQRLSPFYLRNKVIRSYNDKPVEIRRDIVETLDVLVRMRLEGAEPSHTKEGIYA